MSTYVAETDIFNGRRIDLASFEGFLDDGIDNVIERSVFESALEAFAQGRPGGKGDYYVFGVLLSSMDG